MLKLSLKQGEYLNIGDNIRVVYAGGAGNHIRLLVDAPRDVNIARNKTETNPERRKDTYYAEPGISREAQAEIKKILWNERMKAEAKRDAERQEGLIPCFSRIPFVNRQGTTRDALFVINKPGERIPRRKT